jgi:hypothetical protein
VLAAAVALSAGCGAQEQDRAPSPDVSADLERIEEESAGPVYWLGPSFEGLPLTHSEGGQPPPSRGRSGERAPGIPGPRPSRLSEVRSSFTGSATAKAMGIRSAAGGRRCSCSTGRSRVRASIRRSSVAREQRFVASPRHSSTASRSIRGACWSGSTRRARPWLGVPRTHCGRSTEAPLRVSRCRHLQSTSTRRCDAAHSTRSTPSSRSCARTRRSRSCGSASLRGAPALSR